MSTEAWKDNGNCKDCRRANLPELCPERRSA